MNEIQEWYYAHNADVSFGAKADRPILKITAIISSIIVVILCCASFILKDYIYDIVFNPQLKLYVNYNENGYYLDIPYKYDFHAENYIDENTTLKYNEFIDQTNQNYTYSIESDVNTSVIGNYKVSYYSKNKMQSQLIEVVVHVKDLTAPTITLKSTINEIGEYSPITLVRGIKNNGSTLGTLDFNADDYILSITDDFYDTNDIIQENTGHDIDLENGTGTKEFEIIYTATDKAGNSSVVKLPIIVMDEYDAAAEAQKERIKNMEAELNALLKNESNN